MKRVLILLLLLASASLVSCSAEKPSEAASNDAAHIHTFSDKVEYDELGHYATCKCGEVSRSEHIMEDSEVKKITACVEKSITKCKDCEYSIDGPISKISHNYKDEICSACGSHKPSKQITFEFRDQYGWIAIYKDVDSEQSAITELYIPAYTDTGEKVVGVDGFHDLHSLKKIVIPEGIKYILPKAFENCTHLESVNYEGTIEAWRNIDISDTALDSSSVKRVFCSDGIVELYDKQISTATAYMPNKAKI